MATCTFLASGSRCSSFIKLNGRVRLLNWESVDIKCAVGDVCRMIDPVKPPSISLSRCHIDSLVLLNPIPGYFYKGMLK